MSSGEHSESRGAGPHDGDLCQRHASHGLRDTRRAHEKVRLKSFRTFSFELHLFKNNLSSSNLSTNRLAEH